MEKQINVTVNGKHVLAVAGMTVSEIIKGEKPCGGHGRCGKCKVVVRGDISSPCDAELKLLSGDEIARGVRLGCLTYAYGDCQVEYISDKEGAQIVTDGALPGFELCPSFEKFGVAVDVGTTTVAARLYHNRGELLSECSCLNPQSEWGADVISRIEAALGGHSESLASSVRAALDGMITQLAESAGIASEMIDGVVITGNTVMLSLLVGVCVEPFSHAPFDVPRLFGETVLAGELSLSCLSPDTPVYLPPCISAFVGADTTCALLATRFCEGGTAMLADIGTNGEMAIWHGGRLSVCSTAAGPAFEGVGISMGMRGALGAIDKVSTEKGSFVSHVIGDCPPTGICGSGLVDAVACMLDEEILDESGYLAEESFTITEPVRLTQKDIRMLQLAKSAICAGLLTLIHREGLDVADIPSLYIAGGFGSYLNRESAARIGLLPSALAPASRAVGNAALGGASMLLLSLEKRKEAEHIAQMADRTDLSTDPVFSEYYMSGMMLSEI